MELCKICLCEETDPRGGPWRGRAPHHTRSLSSASRAAAISSASELLPSPSASLDSLLESLAVPSSLSFLLWPLSVHAL